jgi:hypothetical protein
MEPDSLTLDLLNWIASAPRTYGDTMDAWRTSCPRLSIWEDAVVDGLVRVRASRVELTERGRAALDQDPNQRARRVAANSTLSAASSRDGPTSRAVGAGPPRKLASTMPTIPPPNSR